MALDAGETPAVIRQNCVFCKKSCQELYRIQISDQKEKDRIGWCSRECVEKYLAREDALKKARERERTRSVTDFSTGHSYTPGQ